MSLLEMTKLYLAKLEKEQSEMRVRVVDGHPAKRVVWETGGSRNKLLRVGVRL